MRRDTKPEVADLTLSTLRALDEKLDPAVNLVVHDPVVPLVFVHCLYMNFILLGLHGLVSNHARCAQ